MLNHPTFIANTGCKSWFWGVFWTGQKLCKMISGNLSINSLMLLAYIVHTDFSFPCSLHRKNLEAELMFCLPMKPYYSGVSIKLPAIPMWMWRTSPKAGLMDWPSTHSYMLTGNIWWISSGGVLAPAQVTPQCELQVFVKKLLHSLFAPFHWRLSSLKWIFFLWGMKNQKLLFGRSFCWA